MAFDKNLEKLNKLLSVLDADQLTKEDFVKSFEGVINFIKKIEKRNNLEIELLKQKFDEFSKKTSDTNIADVAGLKKQVTDYVMAEMKRMSGEHNQIMEMVKNKMAEIRDGKDADEKQIVKNVISQIKLPEQKEVILDNAGQLRDKLETLKEDDRLDKSAIRGLEEALKKSGGDNRIFSIGGAARNAVEFSDLSAQLNGVLKTFSVPKRRFIALFGTQAPVIYRPETDYTGSGTGTLTLTAEVTAPSTGQSLILLHSRI